MNMANDGKDGACWKGVKRSFLSATRLVQRSTRNYSGGDKLKTD